MLVVANVSKLPAIYMSDFSFFALIQGYVFVENVSVNLLSVITQIFSATCRCEKLVCVCVSSWDWSFRPSGALEGVRDGKWE